MGEKTEGYIAQSPTVSKGSIENQTWPYFTLKPMQFSLGYQDFCDFLASSTKTLVLGNRCMGVAVCIYVIWMTPGVTLVEKVQRRASGGMANWMCIFQVNRL